MLKLQFQKAGLAMLIEQNITTANFKLNFLETTFLELIEKTA